jgi:hypothetical protein
MLGMPSAFAALDQAASILERVSEIEDAGMCPVA